MSIIAVLRFILIFFLQIFTSYFSKPIRFVFQGSVELNITLHSLGEALPLTFYSSDVIGKATFGGVKCSVDKKKWLLNFILYLLGKALRE